LCSAAISSKNGGGGGKFCTELFKMDGVRRIGGGGLLLCMEERRHSVPLLRLE